MPNNNGFDQFQGSADYVASEPLKNAVNVSIALQRPLLIRGEAGTGKTLLAHSIAKGLNKKLITWYVKSTTKAQDGLYVYDTVQRLNDSRFGDRDVSDISQYIKLGKLGEAFVDDEQVVLLIDEIDKADLEFPNDLLNELDVMSFYIPETGETIAAKHRPIVIITSNAEKELPDAFLRRCIFHYIEFPDKETMEEIVRVHYPNIQKDLLKEAIKTFYSLREVDEFRKKPSTSELLDWIRALIAGGKSTDEISKEVPYAGALLKKEVDYDYFLSRYMARSGSGIRAPWRY
ncbi:MAG: AAA family ATPase [Dehalococcoidia bacterium]